MSDEKKKLLINWTVASAIAITIFCLFFFLKRDYTLRGGGDGCLIAGAFLVLCPILGLVGRSGLFDTVSYSFVRLGESFRHDETKRFDSAYDYKQYKRKKRDEKKPFYLPYLVIGGIILAIGIGLSLAFDSSH